MSSRLWPILVGLVGALAAVNCPATETLDDDPNIIALYDQGKQLLRQGSFAQAAEIFEQLTAQYPDSRNFHLFLFNRAKAAYHAGDHDRALAGFDLFVARFAGSPYVPFAHYYLGDVHYRLGDVSAAVRHYLESLRLSPEERLNHLLLGSLEAAFNNAGDITLGVGDLAALPYQRRCRAIGVLADELIKRGENARAAHLLRVCDAVADTSFEVSLPAVIWELALMLPFSGELQPYAEDLYNGAVIAAEFYREESGRKLPLLPYDTRGEPLQAGRIAKELGKFPATIAVVGPLTSEGAAVAAAALSCSDLPLIAPAATQAGFARLAETAFQLSPNVELQGSRMADYAVRQLEARTAIVIAPTGRDQLRMVTAFSDRFRQLGGEVLAVEHYRARDRDFGPYILDAKAVLLGLHHDSAFFINDRGDTLEPDGLPARVDCLYLPGAAHQIKQLLPQIHFYKLAGAYLGSDGWGDSDVYSLGDEITKQAVFPSAFISLGDTEEYLRFAAAYDARFGRRPPRLATLGYDAVRLVTGAISAGAESRPELVESLKAVNAERGAFEGASGAIAFGPHQENMELPLYRIIGEQAVPLSESDNPYMPQKTESNR